MSTLEGIKRKIDRFNRQMGGRRALSTRGVEHFENITFHFTPSRKAEEGEKGSSRHAKRKN